MTEQQYSRQDLIEGVAKLRQDGIIDAEDEGAMIRFLDEQKAALVEELRSRVNPEYDRRLAEEGKESADGWFAQEAQELGRRQKAETERFVNTLNATKEERERG